MTNKYVKLLLASSLLLPLMIGCTVKKAETTSSPVKTEVTSEAIAKVNPANPAFSDTLDQTKWEYNETDDVYYQLGVLYCANPETAEYESLAIFVPAAYMTATKNSDGTYTAELNDTAKVGGYTASTAPIVIPVDTPGYAAMATPTSYSSQAKAYTDEGYIYVAAGARGRANGTDESGALTFNGGAPWGVTDFKAAIRYIRYNDDSLAGDTDRIFTFGMSGGGAQSALIGATGDSALYTAYLESIGALMTDKNGEAISDAVAGTVAWCPITSLDVADAAYEWNMGQFSTVETRATGTFTQALSQDLAETFGTYINQLGLTDSAGNALTLTDTEEGIYTSGSYYEYMMMTVEDSLNNFLSDTEFPYTSGGMSGGGPGGGGPEGGMPDGEKPAGDFPTGDLPDKEGETLEEKDGIKRGGAGDMGAIEEEQTYETVSDYIDALNSESKWIIYDEKTNTATVTSLADFVTYMKTPTKSVGAFDSLDTSQGENDLFGTGEVESLHFDTTMAELLTTNQATYAKLTGWEQDYVSAYDNDLLTKDSLETEMQQRANMYNPLYYLLDSYEGAGSSTVAKYWRINSGIAQGDTALSTELNLSLALESNADVESVDFTTVWGQKHVEAERTGESSTNFIQWVNDSLQSAD